MDRVLTVVGERNIFRTKCPHCNKGIAVLDVFENKSEEKPVVQNQFRKSGRRKRYFKKAYKKWTRRETNFLLKNWETRTVQGIANELGRSSCSVASRYSRITAN
jgi:hypothetical protein